MIFTEAIDLQPAGLQEPETIMNAATKFRAFARRMQDEGLPDIAIENFRHNYQQLLAGETGLIYEKDIKPVTHLPDSSKFGDELEKAGNQAVTSTVMIKLNGGLGTSMGLNKAKSLVRIKENLTFLDVIARQAGCYKIPLILMNSFATRKDSLGVLEKYNELRRPDIALDFLQHKVPKIKRQDLLPVDWPCAPELEWNPPGHGDIYAALVSSGMLENLLHAGYKYAFISNSDNLGAVLNQSVLGYLVTQQIPFLMEVADRTYADRKGGHLAQANNGQLVLREVAQCPDDEQDKFQDIKRYRYFNTNNFWLNLVDLQETLSVRGNILGLSIIRNAKTVDPMDPDSTPVYQLETAMGSAISVFSGARAVRVPRSRFAPVKNTGDLLVIRSDAYRLTRDYHLVSARAEADGLPVITLDERYYKMIDDFESRFPQGVPSLNDCRSLTVTGDIQFGAGVKVQGNVTLTNADKKQVVIADGTVITRNLHLGIE
jgi:UTP--glucose-1-phosphate uridylyltransferase